MEILKCLECEQEISNNEDKKDLELCDICMKKFDVNRLWNDHDNNKIDALDFNESKIIRNEYRR